MPQTQKAEQESKLDTSLQAVKTAHADYLANPTPDLKQAWLDAVSRYHDAFWGPWLGVIQQGR